MVCAARLRERLATHVAELQATTGKTPCLTVVIVGEDPASQVYVRMKGEQTQAIGMESRNAAPSDTMNGRDEPLPWSTN